MRPKFTSKQDLSQFENFFRATQQLDSRQVSYGYYDDPHYSGLNTATLAAIHQEGWNGLPARTFMTSAAVAFNKELEKLQKELFGYLASGGRNPTPMLNKIGKAGARKIKFVIDSGLFPHNRVSDAWADVKGFSEAMYHYGDLKESTTFRVSNSRGSRA
ncbi:conserved hypothetical protein [Salmonella phage PVPSE1]|uniref:Uncharacterized protein 64 n=2 Tax=Seunavirus TaxID=1914851 RepID=G3BLS9_9CAUD|nr:tail completion or Neck1 protein [Salmonella phage PVPSE1]YP_009148820.1 tail completion or Neck1 protein [Salmonella phage SSE121]ADP02459.1 conserved hypothetical protein [Salmonella phage PVPSE1]AFU63665.1 hypothetical protein [Salmonella phage SSE121]